jgi:hypothetical protein
MSCWRLAYLYNMLRKGKLYMLHRAKICYIQAASATSFATSIPIKGKI